MFDQIEWTFFRLSGMVNQKFDPEKLFLARERPLPKASQGNWRHLEGQVWTHWITLDWNKIVITNKAFSFHFSMTIYAFFCRQVQCVLLWNNWNGQHEVRWYVALQAFDQRKVFPEEQEKEGLCGGTSTDWSCVGGKGAEESWKEETRLLKICLSTKPQFSQTNLPPAQLLKKGSSDLWGCTYHTLDYIGKDGDQPWKWYRGCRWM